MQDAWDLPPELQGRVFSAAEATRAGAGDRRLRSSRVVQLHRGSWIDATTELTVAVRAQSALTSAAPDAWLSHATAAHLHGLRLPPRLRNITRIDVTTPAPKHAPRGATLRGRQRSLDGSSLQLLHGMRVSDPAQAFVDGTDYLSLPELVALGDGIVDLRRPLATPAELRDAIAAHRGQRNHRRLIAAANLVRPTSRSWAESVSRMTLRDIHAPDAWWNVPVQLPNGTVLSPDCAFWYGGVVMEVEGDQHRTDRRQWLSDLDRYNLLQLFDIKPMRLVVTTPTETRERLENIIDEVLRRWDPARPTPRVAAWYEHPVTFDEGWLFSA